jgi:hypothetical protein
MAMIRADKGVMDLVFWPEIARKCVGSPERSLCRVGPDRPFEGRLSDSALARPLAKELLDDGMVRRQAAAYLRPVSVPGANSLPKPPSADRINNQIDDGEADGE